MWPIIRPHQHLENVPNKQPNPTRIVWKTTTFTRDMQCPHLLRYHKNKMLIMSSFSFRKNGIQLKYFQCKLRNNPDWIKNYIFTV